MGDNTSNVLVLSLVLVASL